jgi:hypothetical protein
MDGRPPSTHDKALAINLDATRYGTFAEIGGGQEVARWFFHVGGAAGTVAKTISAYDMTVSDSIYGPSPRYVSRQRLQAMLDHEWSLLLERLAAGRGGRSRFFVLADTVAIRSYSNPDEGNAWLGMRFQVEPRDAPSELIIHVRLWDSENARQQEALGILGVNLLYGAFNLAAVPERLIGSLMDGLTRERMEVDMIRMVGPAFAGTDNRLMSLQLVQQRLTHAAFFGPDGETVEPAEILHHAPVLVERGSFRPITRVGLDMLRRGLDRMRAEPDLGGADPVVLLEMTLRNLRAPGTPGPDGTPPDPTVEHADFLARVDTLGALGQTVMISNYSRFHNVSTYLRRYTHERLGMILGVPTLAQIFEERHYEDLPGGVLEAFGRLLSMPMRLYVYSWRNPETGEIVDVERFRPPAPLEQFYRHLVANRLVEGLVPSPGIDATRLPGDVLARLQSGESGWEDLVPPEAARVIVEQGLFGYRPRRP